MKRIFQMNKVSVFVLSMILVLSGAFTAHAQAASAPNSSEIFAIDMPPIGVPISVSDDGQTVILLSTLSYAKESGNLQGRLSYLCSEDDYSRSERARRSAFYVNEVPDPIVLVRAQLVNYSKWVLSFESEMKLCDAYKLLEYRHKTQIGGPEHIYHRCRPEVAVERNSSMPKYDVLLKIGNISKQVNLKKVSGHPTARRMTGQFTDASPSCTAGIGESGLIRGILFEYTEEFFFVFGVK